MKKSAIQMLFICLTLLTSPLVMAENEPAANAELQPIPQSDLIYMQLDTGLVVIQLAPFMAPNVSAQFKNLAQEGYYDGLDFYRVIEGFVAQGGDMNETKQSPSNKVINDELSRPLTVDSDFNSIQKPDFFADETGFIQGFPAGRDLKTNEEWLLHCYGTVALARETTINTGSSHFYITIGQAPRRLDRNLTVFGRVIYGMDKVQQIQRAPFGSPGIIENAENRTGIVSMKTGNDVPASQQMHFIQQPADSEAFQNRVQGARTLSNDFYVDKGTGNVDVCVVQPNVTLKPAAERKSEASEQSESQSSASGEQR